MTIEAKFANVIMGATHGTPKQAIDAARDAMLAVLDTGHDGAPFAHCNCLSWGDDDRCRGYRHFHTRIQDEAGPTEG